ncbi:MAG: pyridoxal-dependent decarboxylase [Nakamurella sp.]
MSSASDADHATSSGPGPQDPPAPSGHLTAEEFRRQGHQVIDWIAEYWESVAELPVLSQVGPGEVRSALPDSLPQQGEPLENVIADLDDILLPGITHWQHPRFFAYFPANSTPASVLGDLLSSGIGAQGMLWATSPAVTELEQQVLDSFATVLGLPQAFSSSGAGGGVIQDTASTATFTALLAALHRVSRGAARTDGVGAGRYAVYGSSQAHSSLLKAVMMAGLGERSLRSVPVEPFTQQLDVAALDAAIRADLAAGITPVMIQAAVGTTGTGAVDPVRAMGSLAQEFGIWLHVDAAWAGVAAVCPELRWVIDGVGEFADSFVTNPHKWLLTTFDCSTFWVRDREALIGALSILPEYLRNPASESGVVVDYRDWHPQLGRRFRALKLWTVLRSYGVVGLQHHIRAGVQQARRIADLVLQDEQLVFAAPPVLGLVAFRLADRPELTPAAADRLLLAAMHAVNASGIAYFSHAQVDDRVAIRWAVGGWRTTDADIDLSWRALTGQFAAALPH